MKEAEQDSRDAPPPGVSRGAAGSGGGAEPQLTGGVRTSLLVGALAFLLFGATVAPVVLWGDSAKLTLFAMDFQIGFSPSDHPGYVLLAGLFVRIFPGDPAWLLNLFSALCGGLAVGVVCAMGAAALGPLAGVGAGLALAVAHLFWHAAAMAETYTPATVILSVVFLLGLRYSTRPSLWCLGALGFAVGFGTSVNGIVGLLSPAALILLWQSRRRTRWHWVAVGVVAFLAGLAPYTLGAWMEGDPGAFFRGTVREGGVYLTSIGTLMREAVRYPLYLAYQFPSPALLLIVPGVIFTWRRNRALGLALGLAWAIDVLFGAAWMRQRQFMIYASGLVFPSLFAGAGVAWVVGKWKDRPVLAPALLTSILLLPPLVYQATPPVAVRLGMDLTGARSVPFRDQAYFLRPWKAGYTGTERFAGEVYDVARPGDLVVADFTLYRVLSYLQRRGTGEGVELLEVDGYLLRNDPEGLARRIREGLEEGRVFLADQERGYYFMDYLDDRFRLGRVGILTEVRTDPIS